MQNKYFLQKEGRRYGDWEDVRECKDIDECYEVAGGIFDTEEGDFRIRENDGEKDWFIRIPYYSLLKEECPICGKMYRRYNGQRTYDCHGIPFRTVCSKCYDRVMSEKGYDGEYYTEADENF